jgi:hypothetical protein
VIGEPIFLYKKIGASRGCFNFKKSVAMNEARIFENQTTNDEVTHPSADVLK